MFDKGPTGKPVNVFIKPRKDGKYAVTLCFHSRKLRKVFTEEQVQEYRDDPTYCVQRAR